MVSTNKSLVRVAVSGWYDPFPHVGHIAQFKLAKELGDTLIVIINDDMSAIRKKGLIAVPLEERVEQVRAIRYVDEVVVCIDKDQTVVETLRLIKPNIFAKGKDRTPATMPQRELDVCRELGITIIYGIEGRLRKSTGWCFTGDRNVT